MVRPTANIKLTLNLNCRFSLIFPASTAVLGAKSCCLKNVALLCGNAKRARPQLCFKCKLAQRGKA